MRWGIRRKLIGTLMLVGLFPLVLSLVVILGGGAAIQLSRIRTTYEEASASAAERISVELQKEIGQLRLLSRMPEVEEYLKAHTRGAVEGSPVPTPSAEDVALEARWAALSPNDPAMAGYLQNPAAVRLKLISEVDKHPRQVLLTNAAGQLIASDGKTDDFFQADEEWWQEAFNGGKGKVYISTLTKTNAGGGVTGMKPGEDVVQIAVPVMGRDADGKQVVLGILKDELAASFLMLPLHEQPEDPQLAALTQLIDVPSKNTVYSVISSRSSGEPKNAEKFFFDHQAKLERRSAEGGGRISALTLLFNDLVIGATPVEMDATVLGEYSGVVTPQWVVVVSKPSEEAMSPVYQLALTVAGIGVALIAVLFVMGVAISNREIIMPILRLREATAAVGRGELNVRLMTRDAPQNKDMTFRKDELGDLARDFDEMTRQLQKNVNQLARSNEAKRRFMELAGHELRTPVTFLMGVCQLAQKQLQALSAAATDGGPEDETTIALAAKNATAITGALTKISAKTQRLSRIIDNLLKLVNNDQFTTRMNKQAVDVRALILQVTADHRPFITERKQQLVVDVPQNLPAIEADRDKLEDALSNLVSNAIRFSPDESAVRVAAHEVVGDMLEILVEDSGPGIPAEDLANLFEPFYVGTDLMHHHSGTFEFGSKGLGLGLAIVRRFIELHGGIVRAHAISKDGKTTGTQFQILLPLMKAEEEGGDGSA